VGSRHNRLGVPYAQVRCRSVEWFLSGRSRMVGWIENRIGVAKPRTESLELIEEAVGGIHSAPDILFRVRR
jgi:hypothetical protein